MHSYFKKEKVLSSLQIAEEKSAEISIFHHNWIKDSFIGFIGYAQAGINTNTFEIVLKKKSYYYAVKTSKCVST
jgi:hypothetical protein